jgi:hypothetical protein
MAASLIGEPQAVHCGPWFCASSTGVASVRRSKFTVNPTRRFRFEGIGCNDRYLNLIAFGAFE